MADPKTSSVPSGAKTTKTSVKTSQTGASTGASTTAPTKVETTAAPNTAQAATSPPPSAPPATPPKPAVEYGRRLNVRLNVDTVATAFLNATSSRSVRYVQYALHERGFEPGNDRGRVDYDTRKAYSQFQRSIDEKPTGVPTDYSLDVLGFDVS
jgi:hypothetical protein